MTRLVKSLQDFVLHLTRYGCTIRRLLPYEGARVCLTKCCRGATIEPDGSCRIAHPTFLINATPTIKGYMMSEQALSHLKVVELCTLVSGPYCTKLMADLGAEVIKVEAPGVGDEARAKGPFLKDSPHPELSGLFLHLNTNKLGISLDIETTTGRAILKRLLEQADVFVEDNPPAAMEALELTYHELETINPSLVMTSITPFGQTGPYRDYRAYELNSCHAGGEGYLLPLHSNEPDREPVKPGGIVGDSICGLSACLATLSATFLTAATGVGQHIDLSKQDVLMSLVQNHVCTFANIGELHTRLRIGFLMVLPLECQDGHIMITIVTDREWQSLLDSMGNPSWADDERFATWAGRHWWSKEINPRIQEWVGQFNKDELFHILQRNGVAAVPVATAEDLAKSPQLQERGFFAEIDHPRAGTLPYASAAYQLSGTPWEATRPAPLLGQHNEPVYCDRLGYTRGDLADLRRAGII
jgi:CoA:oxalate CoA-transferase